MSKVKKSIITIFLAAVLITQACAQEELLPEGAYGTTIHGGIKAGELKTYVLDGLEGQVFKANLLTRGVKKGATLDLLDSDGISVLGKISKLTRVDALNLVLPKKDRYQLYLKAGSSGCSYVLEVTLEDAEPSEEKEEASRGRPVSSPARPSARPSKVGP